MNSTPPQPIRWGRGEQARKPDPLASRMVR